MDRPEPGASRAAMLSFAAAAVALALLPAAVHAQEVLDPGTTDQAADASDGDAPRGTVHLGFQSWHTRGSLDGSGEDQAARANLETDSNSLMLGIDYRLGDRWTLHASIPFVSKRAVNDGGGHNPARLQQPHPESNFLDDGAYHGTWQDWELGISYQAWLAGFDVRPRLSLRQPSHDYAFFGSAAPGQRLRSVLLGFDASRRLGRSNFHYSFGYSYEWVEQVLDLHPNRQHFRLSGRYDFSPEWSARLDAVRRKGHGLDPSVFPPEARAGTELWYQHDRMLRHDYTIATIGVSWRFAEPWSVSAATGRMVGGNSIHHLRSLYLVELSRDF